MKLLILQVDKVLYDEKQKSAMVYTTQHLSPKILPFLTFTFPLITILQLSGEHKLVGYQSMLDLN